MKLIDLLKKKAILLSLASGIALTGCSINTDHSKNEPNNISCKMSDETLHENYYSYLEGVMGIKNFKMGSKNNMNLTYLIDMSNLDSDFINNLDEGPNYNPINRVTFAELIDNKTITSDLKLLDGKSTLNAPAFYSDGSTKAWQPIIIPDSYDNKDLIDLIRNGSCDVNCKKFLTMDGETLYYFDGRIINVEGKEVIHSNCLYQFTDDNSLITLYRNQTGIGDQCENVLKNNFNNDSEVVYKLEDTIFKDMSGNYKESYLREALDVYLGEDKYFSSENDGKDFSKYKKVLTKED